MTPFEQRSGTLTRLRLETLQVNLGALCNLACTHCHVEAGPNRTEVMDQQTAQHIGGFLQSNPVQTLDLTGGAPELNPQFRYLVKTARALGMRVMDRCNLTVLFEPDQDDLGSFLAQQHVEIIASLPCYSLANVDQQRGNGVFSASIRALQQLNTLGYGQPGSGLVLNLVYNPVGAFLPPPQPQLEATYRTRLHQDFGIIFNQLFTLTNMPIRRFLHYLEITQQRESYQQLLANAYNPSTLTGLMCRNLISIDWLGQVYDCDFNQMLDLATPGTKGRKIWDLTVQELIQRPIATGDHCFGCTAGSGSSCGGTLVA